MRRIVLVFLFLLSVSSAWATCTVSNIVVLSGASYTSVSGLTVTISGPGAGGATASVNYSGSYPGYPLYTVTSVTVTNSGSYTGQASAFISGGTFAYGTNNLSVVMGGSCATGGGGSRKKFAWLF